MNPLDKIAEQANTLTFCCLEGCCEEAQWSISPTKTPHDVWLACNFHLLEILRDEGTCLIWGERK